MPSCSGIILPAEYPSPRQRVYRLYLASHRAKQQSDLRRDRSQALSFAYSLDVFVPRSPPLITLLLVHAYICPSYHSYNTNLLSCSSVHSPQFFSRNMQSAVILRVQSSAILHVRTLGLVNIGNIVIRGMKGTHSTVVAKIGEFNTRACCCLVLSVVHREILLMP